MNRTFFHTPIDPKSETGEHELIRDEDQQHNIADGAEFLDDGLRMKDQPLFYTEEEPL